MTSIEFRGQSRLSVDNQISIILVSNDHKHAFRKGGDDNHTNTPGNRVDPGGHNQRLGFF